MAEVVHRNLESMLPQLEELESSGIFSHDEIKLIVRRRRNHEYKLLRRPARKEDFLAAVQYELHLDQLRQHRKKKLGISTTKQDAEYGIQNRIHSLFNRALKKFKGDLKLWLQHIEFSKQCGHKVSLSKTFGRALAVHPNKPGLWVLAGKFEFEEMKDIASARALLQQGLRANSRSKHLWIEYFRMELLHTDKVKKRRAVLGLEDGEAEEPTSDDFMANKAASLVYKQAIKSIPDDIEFRLSFLPIYRLFSETGSLQEEVYNDIQSSFPTDPLTWEALARRHWEGVDSAALPDTQVEVLDEKTEHVFREGISNATIEHSDDGSCMEHCQSSHIVTQHWDKYIQWCKERVEDTASSDRIKKKAIHRMLVAFNESSGCGQLSEAKFEEYVHILYSLGLTCEAADISRDATAAHPECIDLWLQRLKCVCSTGVPSSGSSKISLKSCREVCEEALENIPYEASLPVWQFWVKHSVENKMTEKDIESLFKRSLDCGVAAVFETLSGQYLEWAYDVGGVKKARKIYKKLLKERVPIPYVLYEQCIEVEKKALMTSESPKQSDNTTSLTSLRELFKQALEDYGSSHPELWLGCIEMELTHTGGQLENVGNLHWKAVKELKPELTADFIANYSLMQNKLVCTRNT